LAETNIELAGGGTPDRGADAGEASLSFEEAMEKLEAIVARLESGDVPLEQAIELFQEGMKLSQLCGSKLEQVERKIEMLIETEQGLQRKAFAPEESTGFPWCSVGFSDGSIGHDGRGIYRAAGRPRSSGSWIGSFRRIGMCRPGCAKR